MQWYSSVWSFSRSFFLPDILQQCLMLSLAASKNHLHWDWYYIPSCSDFLFFFQKCTDLSFLAMNFNCNPPLVLFTINLSIYRLIKISQFSIHVASGQPWSGKKKKKNTCGCLHSSTSQIVWSWHFRPDCGAQLILVTSLAKKSRG